MKNNSFFGLLFGSIKNMSEKSESQRRNQKYLLLSLSIFIALFMWLFVVDPVKSITIPVKVKTKGLSNENIITGRNIYVANNIPKYADITVDGRNSYLKNMNENDFYVLLDFKKVEDVNQSTLNMEVPMSEEDLVGIKISRINPAVLELDLDEYSGLGMDVELKSKGTLKSGYKVNLSTDTESIQLTGTNAVIRDAVSAVINVDVSDITESFQRRLYYIKILDKQGKEIEGTERQHRAYVTADVARGFTVLPVLEGKLPNGYYTQTPVVSPSMVYLYGSEEIFPEDGVIRTDRIDISKFRKTTTITVQPVIPPDATLESPNQKFTVTIPIETDDETTVQFSAKSVVIEGMSDRYNYTVQPEKIPLVIRGPESIIAEIDVAELTVTANVSRLSNGMKTVEVAADLPQDCELAQKAVIRVRVDEKMSPIPSVPLI